MPRSFPDIQPLPHRSESLLVLTLPRQRFSQPGQPIGTQSNREGPDKPVTQTGDSLLEYPLRRHHGAAQDLRFDREPKPLRRSEHLDGLDALQSYFRRVAIEVKHGVHGHGCSQGERVSDPFSQCQCLSPDHQSGIGIPEQPMDLRTHVAGANARVAAAVKASGASDASDAVRDHRADAPHRSAHAWPQAHPQTNTWVQARIARTLAQLERPRVGLGRSATDEPFGRE